MRILAVAVALTAAVVVGALLSSSPTEAMPIDLQPTFAAQDHLITHVVRRGYRGGGYARGPYRGGGYRVGGMAGPRGAVRVGRGGAYGPYGAAGWRGGTAVGPRGGRAVWGARGAVGPYGAAGVRGGAVVGPRGNVYARRTVVVNGRYRPYGAWWPAGGAIAAGAAIGFVTAATAVAWAGAPPAAGYCWYYTDPSRTTGFWDRCP